MKHVSKVLPAAFLLVLASADAMAAGSLLRITCEGADARAEVMINGVFKGECPLDVQVNPGSIELRVVKRIDADRERVYADNFRIGDGVVKKVDAVLNVQFTTEGARRQREREAAREAAAAEERRRAEESLQQVQRAAEAGDPAAMADLAERYATGNGVPKNTQQAYAWNRKAADAGSPLAAFRLSSLPSVAPKPLVDEVLRMLALPAGPERVVSVEGAESIRGFVLNDPFFEVPGGNRKVTFRNTAAYQSGQKVEQATVTCGRDGRLFERVGIYKSPDWSVNVQTTAAIVALGRRYESGVGVPRDFAQALAMYKKAADAGDADAMYELGAIEGMGLGGRVNRNEALAWYRRSAQAGGKRAMWAIGLAYLVGQGVEVNHAEAVDWLRKAADAGDPFGMMLLRQMYRSQTGVKYDGDLVAKLFDDAVAASRAAAEGGDTEAMKLFATLLQQADKSQEAARWRDGVIERYRQRGDAGDVRAMFELGHFYYSTLKDSGAAISWFRRAADGGCVDAMMMLGALHGAYAPARNPREERAWYQRAAERGEPAAVQMLKYLK